MKVTSETLALYNEMLRSKSPKEITAWVLDFANSPIVTTNFGPFSASMLNLVTSVKSDIPVIWCDTGYNTSHTYLHAKQMSKALRLNLFTYVPLQTASQRDAFFGGIPKIGDPNHKIFTKQVKLEPFRRAMKFHRPDVWFSNIRKGQTAWRDTLDILSFTKDGLLKVSPFYNWSNDQLAEYLSKNNLPNEQKYFDPTKVLENRECGLHN